MDPFYRLITPILGGIIGLLMAFPASMMGPAGSPGLGVGALLLPVIGVLIGYRKRDSRVFFYFSLICATLLAGIVGLGVIGHE